MCKTDGKIPAEIYNKEQNNVMQNFSTYIYSPNRRIWIGLTYSNTTNNFVWETSGIAPNFTNWEEGYPNNNSQWKCVFTSQGKWQNTNCEFLHFGVCQVGKICFSKIMHIILTP